MSRAYFLPLPPWAEADIARHRAAARAGSTRRHDRRDIGVLLRAVQAVASRTTGMTRGAFWDATPPARRDAFDYPSFPPGGQPDPPRLGGVGRPGAPEKPGRTGVRV